MNDKWSLPPLRSLFPGATVGRVSLLVLFVSTLSLATIRGEDPIYELAEGSRLSIRAAPCTADTELTVIALQGTFALSVNQQNARGFGATLTRVEFSGSQDGKEYVVTGTGSYWFTMWVWPGEIPFATGATGFDVTVNEILDVHFSPPEMSFEGHFPLISGGGWAQTDEHCLSLAVKSRPSMDSLGLFFRRGDTNGDGVRDIADPLALLFHMFHGRSLSCLDAADSDDNGALEIADAVALLCHLFIDHRSLLAPNLYCGIDLSEDALDCNGGNSCTVP